MCYVNDMLPVTTRASTITHYTATLIDPIHRNSFNQENNGLEGLLDCQCLIVALPFSKELLLQSEGKARLAAQIASRYDWRSPKRGSEGRSKPSFLNAISQVWITSLNSIETCSAFRKTRKRSLFPLRRTLLSVLRVCEGLPRNGSTNIWSQNS